MCIGGYRDNFQCGGKCFGVLGTGDFYLTDFWTLVIICLTREPEGERASPDPALYQAKKQPSTLPKSGRLFLIFHV